MQGCKMRDMRYEMSDERCERGERERDELLLRI